MTEKVHGEFLEHKSNGVYKPAKDSTSSRWSFLLLASGLAMTIGTGIPVGYNIGVINSPAEFIRDWCNQTIIDRYDVYLTPDQLELLWSTIASIFLVGACVGSLLVAWLANSFGRKGTLFICAITFAIAAVLFYFCRALSSVEVLLLARFIVGLASGATYAVLGMYLAEIAPFELRGTLATFSGLGVTSGVVVGQIFSLPEVFGTEDLWHLSLSFYIVFNVICFLPYVWYPESPKYLYIVVGKQKAARNELLRLRAGEKGSDEFHSRIDAELVAMEEEALTQTEARSIWSVLTDKTLLMPLILLCGLQGGSQMSGINCIFVYSVSIFKRVGMSDKNAKWANFATGVLNLFVALASPKIMEKINRRPIVLFSCLFSGIFLVTLTLFMDNIDAVSWFPIASVLSVFGYIIAFQIGLGPIPFFIGSELFEISSRPAAMAIGSLSCWFGNVAVGMSFLSIQTAFGAYVFLPFAAVCFSLVILNFIYLPETRGKEPADVAPLVSKGFQSKRR